MSFSNDILLIREVDTVKTTGLLEFSVNIKYKMGRDSVVSIETRSGLDGSGFEPRCIQEMDFFFTTAVPPALGLTQPPAQWVPYFCTRGTAAGAWH
jgi:hypothetical protein